MAKSKKVVLFIVEGQTDQDTLSPILKKIFNKCNVRFHITKGDLLVKTKENDIIPANAIMKINAHIKNEMQRYGYTPKDMVKVIHLIDTDGAFIPNDKIILNCQERMKYCTDRIETKNPEATKRRNEGKKAIVHRLKDSDKIGGIPYCMLFFSRNLEHVLHNIERELTKDEKIDLADDFAFEYSDNIDGFKALISSEAIKAPGDYRETWDFILTGTNSLNRFSNLHLILEDKHLFPQETDIEQS